MTINIKALTFGKPTFSGTGSTATISAIPITVEAFDNDLDNVLVTKLFQSFNTGNGTFENITGASLTKDVAHPTTNATVNFSTPIAATTTFLIRLFETDTTVSGDTNDTSFVVQDLFTLFTAGDCAEDIALQLAPEPGNYKVRMSQIDETNTTLDTTAFDTALPPTTAKVAVITDYVTIAPSTVIKVRLSDATDVNTDPFAGSIRSSFRIISA